jgi:hypothetical protein
MLPSRYLPIRIRKRRDNDVLRLQFGDDPRATLYLYCMAPGNRDVAPTHLRWMEGLALMKAVAKMLDEATRDPETQKDPAPPKRDRAD